MHNKIQLLSVVALLANLVAALNAPETDYYWVDYNGKVPEEAMPGGTDAEGNATYIGKTIVKNDPKHWVVGEIDAKLNTLTYVESGVLTILEFTRGNFKILCVHTPELYHWVHFIRIPKPLLAQGNFVVGGNLRDAPYFVARKEITGTRRVIGRAYLAGDNYISMVYRTPEGPPTQEIACGLQTP